MDVSVGKLGENPRIERPRIAYPFLAMEDPGSDAVAQAWMHVQAHWHDEAAHRAFLRLCSGCGRLADAGRCYRRVVEGEPARRQEAERWIAAILAAALQGLELTRTPRRSRSRLGWVLIGAGGVGLAWALFTTLRLLAQ